jgi:hypothetical protein
MESEDLKRGSPEISFYAVLARRPADFYVFGRKVAEPLWGSSAE